MSPATNPSRPHGLVPALVAPFLSSHLAGVFLVLALALGITALLVTPREEEPQIVVPMADVIVHAPGAGPREVEKLVATPLEKLLWQIDGVEYVYSESRRDQAVVTVRFFVGEDRERSLVKLHNKIIMHEDQVPPLVTNWLIRPVEIDDVPVLMLTLFSPTRTDAELRRIGEEFLTRLSEVPAVSRAEVFGGRQREIRVEPDPLRMAGHGVTFADLEHSLAAAGTARSAGSLLRGNRELNILGDGRFTSAADVAGVVVGVHQDRPVHLRDVARVLDGPEEPFSYARIRLGDHRSQSMPDTGLALDVPAVTLALAKQRGANAVTVTRDILAAAQELRPLLLPEDVHLEVTRDYGQTAQDKVSDLLWSLVFAVSTVVIILALTLGWRAALVVAVAIPVSFSLALFSSHLLGYTINRVTLFALILSLGLVVDDPITNVDNIRRHLRLHHPGPVWATLSAVAEVFVPVIMSTLAIIACFLPLFFITGMMGPYMAPMAANVPLTVLFSTACALTIVPWLCFLLLRGQVAPGTDPPQAQTAPAGSNSTGVPDRVLHGYRTLIGPFLDFRILRMALVGVVLALLVLAASLVLLRLVPLKMLPFDNRDEFQVVVNMDEGTPLETTDAVLRDMTAYLAALPETASVLSFAGIASPMDFNGMVRRYYAREGGHLGDIRINLTPKSERRRQSHEIVLSVRHDLERIAKNWSATIQIVEIPPGPPVMATLVAEIYGGPEQPYVRLFQGAEHVRAMMETKEFVVDVDDSRIAPRPRLTFFPDREKAALHGLGTQDLIHALHVAAAGTSPATIQSPEERQTLPVRVILPRELRISPTDLEVLHVRGTDGSMLPLGELGQFVWEVEEQPILHKNLRRVVYVTAETVGLPPAEAVLDLQAQLRNDPPPAGVSVVWTGEGEWKITVDVFRDLGLAFGAALVGIYLLLVVQTASLALPLLIMSAIPLTLMGIMPGFWLLNLLTARDVDGFADPVFFTATAMIGMIALGGIVIRNSLVLIDFIRAAVARGQDFREAVLQSGAIRLQPIVLTALTTALGVWPITLDPVFSGLAWALIFGLIASTLFTLVLIPVAYFVLFSPET
ncbi:efflux RND transporter permease subunit [Desulfonatronum thioautotrophicum]|uniref:efflux RND transporter permease subunit n=1 Tax=Desulfonatronum thioautotrophicum TaxID=617001 RepID=UPI0005EB5999|nr:efflux RND transporter permease subunit [Desulfonatronum thioautotrophicum]